MGREVVVAITKGEFDFGPWEQIFYGEFDGMRRKRVLIKNYRGINFSSKRAEPCPPNPKERARLEFIILFFALFGV